MAAIIIIWIGMCEWKVHTVQVFLFTVGANKEPELLHYIALCFMETTTEFKASTSISRGILVWNCFARIQSGKSVIWLMDNENDGNVYRGQWKHWTWMF